MVRSGYGFYRRHSGARLDPESILYATHQVENRDGRWKEQRFATD